VSSLRPFFPQSLTSVPSFIFLHTIMADTPHIRAKSDADTSMEKI
jgi:hypothetical protein